MASVFWNVFACCRRVQIANEASCTPFPTTCADPCASQGEPNERTPLNRGGAELNLPGAHDRSQDENARNERFMTILRTVADNMVDVSSPSPFRAEARLGLPSPVRGRTTRARTPSPHTPPLGATHAGIAVARAATPTVPRVPRVNLRHVRGGSNIARMRGLSSGTGRGAPLSKRTMQIAPDSDEDDANGDPSTPAVRVQVSDHDSQQPEPEAGALPHPPPPQNAVASLATGTSQQRSVLLERHWDDD
ncbi:hypothetical protein EXIGLDRAFT_768078 [Exidia glandulosa HHB12029]|uniref:Uncharacterized protein n=1 Tax=Exidia glandulosa HHB12029 TaxID=1314781 RepID=A0A165IHY9_EXIGL|nr:hypothetical protein EXIGLDRAFT_768078 [Exidia glandulosa HHB12029]